jgi:hypothetical protein
MGMKKMIDVAYITAVLGRFEGKGVTKGYVPSRGGEPLGASGVTIATGLDLGQQSLETLRAMNMPGALISRFMPYLGLHGKAAQRALLNAPLILSAVEAEEVDRAVHAKYIAETSTLFGRPAFESAPKEVQAVAVSLHYQFGTPARAASPALENAWNAMRRGDYKAAGDLLRDPTGWSLSHRQYMQRRRAEAELLAAPAGGKYASEALLPKSAGVAQSSHTLASADGHKAAPAGAHTPSPAAGCGEAH